MIWLVLVSSLICITFYYFCIKPMSYWKKRGVKQGTPVWFFGDNLNAFLRKESFTETVGRLYNQHPNERYSGVYQMTTPTLYLRDPELIRQITVKDFEYFMDHRPLAPANADLIWSKNLFALRGKKWRDMRPLLSPSFTSSKMKVMFVLMRECAESFIKYLKDHNEALGELDMKDIFTRYSNNVIASVVFGVEVDSLKERDNEFYLMGQQLNFNTLWRTLKVFGYFVLPKFYEIFKISIFAPKVMNFFAEMVEETIKIREDKGISRPDMINSLMEARKGDHKPEKTIDVDTGFATVQEVNLGKSGEFQKQVITNLDIAAQAMVFFFAGYDTVTAMMCFMAYELAVNPDVQSKLRYEIEMADEECNGKLTYEVLMEMKYMDMVVCETMRKWPIAFGIDRLCTKPYTIQPTRPDEIPLLIEKDEAIWIPIYGIHHDPKYYPDPEKFDPERFSDSNKQHIVPYTYLPFGVGPRNCIGSRFGLLECKAVFFYLLLDFELVPVKKTQIPLKLAKNSFSMQAERGIWLSFKNINK